MIKKVRIPIPDDIAAEVLFLSDRTCCVCNLRGKQIQIHHIDETPSNNDMNNLSVLCFECHDQTMIKGGFGRKLEASQIIKYRNEWHDRVKARKMKADELASIQTLIDSTDSAAVINWNEEDNLYYKTNWDQNLLREYLGKILIVHQAQLTIARTKWDSMVLFDMIQGNDDIADFYEGVLIELATFYPKGHFDDQSPQKYFNEVISGKFVWHRLLLGSQAEKGTIIYRLIGFNVIRDLKNLVVDMVNSLCLPNDIKEENELKKWTKKWLR